MYIYIPLIPYSVPDPLFPNYYSPNCSRCLFTPKSISGRSFLRFDGTLAKPTSPTNLAT